LLPTPREPGMAAAALVQNGSILRPGFFKLPLTQNPLALAALIGVEQESAQFFGPGFLVLRRVGEDVD